MDNTTDILAAMKDKCAPEAYARLEEIYLWATGEELENWLEDVTPKPDGGIEFVCRTGVSELFVTIDKSGKSADYSASGSTEPHKIRGLFDCYTRL